jgi:SPP1 gp7 family putative phage head morphogenesis protein
MVRTGIYTREFALKVLGHDITDMKGGTYLIPMNILPETAKATKAKSASRLSDEQKEAMWRVYAARTEAEEKPFIRTLRKLFEEQRDEVISNLQQFNNADFDEVKAIEKFETAFKPLIHDVFLEHYTSTIEGLKPEHPHTHAVKQDEFLSQDALEWIATRSLSMAKMVNGTTKEQLRLALAEGFQAGEGVDELTARIRSFYQDGFERRAPLVARTEVIAASAQGSIKGYEDMAVERVEFYAALDERTCPQCMEKHENTYPVKESRGIIPVHPQCRCVWLPVV